MTRISTTLLLFAMLISSCNEDVVFETRISILNEIDSAITVNLNPKSNRGGGLYKFSDNGSGFRDSESIVQQGEGLTMYWSIDLSVEPYDLTKQIFYSIEVVASDSTIKTLYFSPDSTSGYTDNLFFQDSDWHYELKRENFPTNFRSNPHEIRDFTFILSEDKLVK